MYVTRSLATHEHPIRPQSLRIKTGYFVPRFVATMVLQVLASSRKINKNEQNKLMIILCQGLPESRPAPPPMTSILKLFDIDFDGLMNGFAGIQQKRSSLEVVGALVLPYNF